VVVHTFHLAAPGLLTTVATLVRPPTPAAVPGLQHAECMMPMRLGAALLSPARWRLRQLAMFAAWDDESAVDAFLQRTRLGGALARGWHVRLRFLRRWGHVAAFDGLPARASETDADAPVVAVTVARVKLSQMPRFVRWGLPVERLVRDHPGTTLALAATRPARTIATFTVWRSARAMLDMVHGRGESAAPERHAAAMNERRRKDFHTEFTTLRFTCTGEYGAWEGRTAIVPTTNVGQPSEQPAAGTRGVEK
jgi:hypothetical protein